MFVWQKKGFIKRSDINMYGPLLYPIATCLLMCAEEFNPWKHNETMSAQTTYANYFADAAASCEFGPERCCMQSIHINDRLHHRNASFTLFVRETFDEIIIKFNGYFFCDAVCIRGMSFILYGVYLAFGFISFDFSKVYYKIGKIKFFIKICKF